MELLFESRIDLLDFEGHLRFLQQRPTVHPEPVLWPDRFADAKGVSIYGSVLRDGGMLRMWYQGMPEDWDYARDMASVCYAESSDGYTWTKPALGQVEHGPAPNNLLALALHCPSVFIDPDSPPGHRYRATGCAYPGLFMAPAGITEQGYYTAHSADGLHWQFDAETPTWRSADVITSIHHPGQRRGIVAMKFTPRSARMLRRCIHTAELRDGVYSEHVSALYPDEADDFTAAGRGYHSCDYYGMGMQAAGSGTVGFLWNYWHGLPYTGNGHVALYGTSDITLVYQAERGGRWLHMPGRPTFIDHTERDWMNGWINSSSCPVEVGDEHCLYFSGTPLSHGFTHDTDWKPIEKWTDWAAKYGAGYIGFASWPKWRLFGFQGDPEGRFTIDLGEIEKPSELFLNYGAHRAGRVRVEIYHQEGRGLDDCLDLETDSLHQKVEWKSGSIIHPQPGKHLFARLHVECATVYAYELLPAA